MLEVNQILQEGRYRILEQNGQDGVGQDYQAYDNFLKANVALREISGINEKNLSQDRRGIDYAKKATNLAQIKHDSLLNVHDYFSEIDRQYLVLESVEGDSISRIVEKNNTPINLVDFIKWSDQLLDAVTCLQNRIPPIIHGEIRPQNIKLTTSNRIKLITFSFGKQNEQNPDSSELPFFSLERIWKSLDSTSKQFILRSYDEKSERILEQPLDVRSDVYSVGATLYYLATGKRPVDALERTIDVLEGKADPLQPINKLNPAIPSEISNIVMEALEIKRENRFDSALMMQSILRGTIIRLKQYSGEVTAALKADSVEKEKLSLEQKVVKEEKIEIQVSEKHSEEQIEVKPDETFERETTIEDPELPKLIEETQLKVEPPPFEVEKPEVEDITESEIAETSEEMEKPLEEVLTETTPSIGESNLETDYTSETDNWDEMFITPEKQKGNLGRMAAFAVGLIALGGIGWGVWTLNSSDSATPSQNIPNQSVVLPTETPTPKAEVEATPAPSVAPTPEINSSPNPPETTVAEKPASPSEIKNKPIVSVPSATPIKKKAEAPKPSATPKKITVDDLIKDN